MKHRLSFAIVVLIAAMLACGTLLSPRTSSQTTILSVAVIPRSGSGIFTLEVTYKTGNWADLIYCNYVDPDFGAMGIGQIKIEYGKLGTRTERLPFPVTQPGTYVAGCGTEGGNTLTTTFEVVGEKEQADSFFKVLNVAVTPSSGSGNFTLEVTYNAYPSPTIHCNYVSPDGAITALGEIVPTYRDDGGFTKTERLVFSVTQPGVYQAGCSSAADGVSVTTTFTVVEETLSSVNPPAESMQPIQVKGTGQKTTSNWDFQPNYCTTTADLVLTITEDGWGKLEITGDAFYDHMNCLGGIGWEKWLVEGAANVANETVSFMSCSRGDTASNEFNAQGTISYSGGALSGEVTCLGKTGSEAGRVVTIIKAP